MILVFGTWLLAEGPEGSNTGRVVLTIEWVGHVLWLIYKMSELYGQRGLYILGICSQESEIMGMQKQQSKVVYTGMEGTGLKSEEIKQCEIITILGKQGQSWGSANVGDWCNPVGIWPRVIQGCPQTRDYLGGCLRVWWWLKSLCVLLGCVRRWAGGLWKWWWSSTVPEGSHD